MIVRRDAGLRFVAVAGTIAVAGASNRCRDRRVDGGLVAFRRGFGSEPGTTGEHERNHKQKCE